MYRLVLFMSFGVRDRSVSSTLQAPRSECAWTEEKLYFSGDEYFAGLEASLASASRTIDVEAYIFKYDRIGRRIAWRLIEAAGRRVQVRVLVDGIGSAGWVYHYGAAFERAGIRYKVFHQLPWETLFTGRVPGGEPGFLLSFVRRLNQRNHRKIFIIDGREAWLGGMNIWDVQLASVTGESAWRDTGVMVQGEPVADLSDSFFYHWLSPRRRLLWRVHRWKSRDRPFRSPFVLINSIRRLRIRNYRNLLRRIRKATSRVWITASYFVPPGSLVRALENASRNGADVRIIVPSKSDIFFLPWVTAAFYFSLLRAGVRIFEYSPSVLHAKSTSIDDWAIVGSSNLNHRSWMHDLEADVVLCHGEAKRALAERFVQDLRCSREVHLESYRDQRLFRRLIGRLTLCLRYWM